VLTPEVFIAEKSIYRAWPVHVASYLTGHFAELLLARAIGTRSIGCYIEARRARCTYRRKHAVRGRRSIKDQKQYWAAHRIVGITWACLARRHIWSRALPALPDWVFPVAT